MSLFLITLPIGIKPMPNSRELYARVLVVHIFSLQVVSKTGLKWKPCLAAGNRCKLPEETSGPPFKSIHK